MNRQHILDAFEDFLNRDKRAYPGDMELAGYLSFWFRTRVPNEYPFYDPSHVIPRLLAQAMMDLREKQTKVIVNSREEYLKLMKEKELQCLTSISSAGIFRTIMIGNLARLIQTVLDNDEIASEITNYFRAEDMVLDQNFQNFLFKVYNNGLMRALFEQPNHAVKGIFGGTALRLFETSDEKVHITFACSFVDSDDRRMSFTYDCRRDDLLGANAGCGYANVPLADALSMINDVISHWPTSSVEQHQMLQPLQIFVP